MAHGVVSNSGLLFSHSRRRNVHR